MPTGPLRTVLTATIGVLPAGRFKLFLLRRLLGWNIGAGSTVGPCLFLHVNHVSLDENVHLHSFSAYHGLERLVVGANGAVGHWNWIAAATDLRTTVLATRPGVMCGQLILGRHSAITARHYIDCSGGVEIGAFTTVAGVRSTILTHQIDVTSSHQDLLPVRIGDYCLIGSNVCLVPGSLVPDRCLVGMGSVVVSPLPEKGILYAGVPARAIKRVDDGVYFRRPVGYVEPP